MEALSAVTKTLPDGVLVVYDQIGNGLSTHLPEKMGDAGFWTEQLFLDELENVLKVLEVEVYDLFWHSWSGMLGVRHAVKQPAGLTCPHVRAIVDAWMDCCAEWIEGQVAQRYQRGV